MTIIRWRGILALGAVAFIAYLLLKKEAGQAVVVVGDSINPVNQDNIFYRGSNAVGEKLTGDKHFTLGGWLYEKFNG